jgi:hypothetical protein
MHFVLYCIVQHQISVSHKFEICEEICEEKNMLTINVISIYNICEIRQ